MSIDLLPVTKLRLRIGARKVDEAKIGLLMESIRDVGIINPLRVRPKDIYENGRPVAGWEVTTGAHRLEAATRLRMAEVPCIIVTDDDLHAELAMIDENLCRAELTPAQAANQTVRRKEIYEALHPEAKHGANQHTRSGQIVHSSFADETARATGRDARTVRRDAARGEALGEDLNRIAGTSLDKGVELDALRQLPSEEREDIVARAERGERVSARAPRQSKQTPLAPEPMNGFEAKEKWMTTMMNQWNKGSDDWRREFLDRAESSIGSVMDKAGWQ